MDKELIEYIKKVIVETTTLIEDIENIGLDEDLMDYGLNSLTFVKVMVRFEEDLDVCMDDYDIDDFEDSISINQLVEMIKNIKE